MTSPRRNQSEFEGLLVMKLVIVESPFAGDVEGNQAYACAACRDCLERGESPIASHLLFPQFLDDMLPSDRVLGIKAGLAWRAVADYSVFYTDRGWSLGMNSALRLLLDEERVFHIRGLFGNPSPPSGEFSLPDQARIAKALERG